MELFQGRRHLILAPSLRGLSPQVTGGVSRSRRDIRLYCVCKRILLPVPAGGGTFCAGTESTQRSGIGEGLSVRSRAQTAPPLCTPPAHFRWCKLAPCCFLRCVQYGSVVPFMKHGNGRLLVEAFGYVPYFKHLDKFRI